MRKALSIVLLATALLMVIGVVVFHHSLGLSWLDAIYFVITTMTTVGYGDINLQNTPAAVKLFGNFLMVAGAASLAALFGIITDTILRTRLQEFFGKRRRPMQDHIVLCGLGNVGYRIVEQLHNMGEKIVVVEKSEDCKFLEDARQLGVNVVIGDIRLLTTLEHANVQEARCLIAASDEDLANLESALNARSLNEEIRIVMRMFDQNLANKIRKGFGIRTAFSTSALAAPVFAMAAVDPAVIGSFYVGEDLMLNLEITVNPGADLTRMSTADLESVGKVSILAHQSKATGTRQIHPSKPLPLEPGDKLVISTLRDFVTKIHELNTSTDS
jgi:Trk K+ transport system NAD-binding subunit